MTTVVGLALWCLLAAGGWWLAGRVQLLLNYAEELLAMGAKDRHPAGSRIEAQPVAAIVEEPRPTPFPRGRHRIETGTS